MFCRKEMKRNEENRGEIKTSIKDGNEFCDEKDYKKMFDFDENLG